MDKGREPTRDIPGMYPLRRPHPDLNHSNPSPNDARRRRKPHMADTKVSAPTSVGEATGGYQPDQGRYKAQGARYKKQRPVYDDRAIAASASANTHTLLHSSLRPPPAPRTSSPPHRHHRPSALPPPRSPSPLHPQPPPRNFPLPNPPTISQSLFSLGFSLAKKFPPPLTSSRLPPPQPRSAPHSTPSRLHPLCRCFT